MNADNIHLAGAISQGEVQDSVNQALNTSAPGPDGVEKQDILNWDPRCETLTRLYNMWWFTGIVTSRLNE